VTLFLIGLLVLIGWAVLCFWLAIRFHRRCIARGVAPNRNYLATLIVAGAGCAIMAFVLLFQTFNPPPVSFGKP
jgi:drug/metabolite transporter (DMT)-like permease